MSKKSKKSKKQARAEAEAQAKRNKLMQRLAIFGVAVIAVAGLAWLAVQPAVGEGLTVRAIRTPT